MSRTYTYVGEAEMVVPFTVDGPRVLSAGDTVRVPDGESLDGHPSFVPEGAGGSSEPAVPVAVEGSETAAPAVLPVESAVAEAVSDPADPTAQAAAGQE